MSPLDVIARQALSQEDSPYGSVGVLHAGSDLEAWWIWKDGEEAEPALSVMDRDDLLYVVRGSLRLELEGRDPVVLRAGELVVIPAGTRSAAAAGRATANPACSSRSHPLARPSPASKEPVKRARAAETLHTHGAAVSWYAPTAAMTFTKASSPSPSPAA